MRRTLPSLILALLTAASLPVAAQPPELASWILNRDGATGYGGILSNVQSVRYSDSNVYVACTCIPGYDIGPWQGNPNAAANQNFVFKITRSPRLATDARTETPLGHIGVWTNGVSIFNARDARSYQNRNVWHQDAVVVEGPSFDACLGHPAPNGEYHHHLNPTCLYDDRDSSRHSPIIGYAFDGFPIYGAYGYAKSDGSGGVTRMRSSYRLRAITDRSRLADGTELATTEQGPAISQQYPLGFYCEDREYVEGLGDLDEHNGRFCVTPEYPEGTYAYFVTLDEKGVAAYPYTLGPTYRGIVVAGNTGPQSGHVTPVEPVITWGVASSEPTAPIASLIRPIPATGHLTLRSPDPLRTWRYGISDATGRRLTNGSIAAGTAEITLATTGLPSGAIVVIYDSEGEVVAEKGVVGR